MNAFQGGHDIATKKELIARFTEAMRQHAGIPADDLAPVYIIFRDVPASDWGVFGATITLNELRHPPAGAAAI